VLLTIDETNDHTDLAALLICLSTYITSTQFIQHLKSMYGNHDIMSSGLHHSSPLLTRLLRLHRFSIQFYDSNVSTLGPINMLEHLQTFLIQAYAFPPVSRDPAVQEEFIRGLTELGHQLFAGQLDFKAV
jgi:hypothetical protein